MKRLIPAALLVLLMTAIGFLFTSVFWKLLNPDPTLYGQTVPVASVPTFGTPVSTATPATITAPWTFSTNPTFGTGVFLQGPNIQSATIQQAFYSGQGAAVTLVPAQCGAQFLFDRGSAQTYTLPALVPAMMGCQYEFFVSVYEGVGQYQIAANGAAGGSGTQFFAGTINTDTAAGAGAKQFQCNGTSHVAIWFNGSTTGAYVGTTITVQAMTSTLWQVMGQVVASGSIATPCQTSVH